MQGPYVQPPQVQGPYIQAPQMQAPQFQPGPVEVQVPQQTNYLPLVLILAGLLLVAIILVVYFALRH